MSLIKIVNPTTPSQRNLIKLKNNHLSKSPFLKSHIFGSKKSSGRNSYGKITVYHKGGGHKKKYRKINFLRTTVSLGIIVTIEYDPNRTANIASVYNILGDNYFYILAPKNLTVGDIIKAGPNANIKIGHSLPISKIPVGSLIHAISTKKNKKSEISRAAGTFSQLIEKNAKYARIKLSSKRQKFIPIHCYATIGIVSNELLFLTNVGKAGRSRWLNKRPTVRGVAMNPIDHPHGGGEGKKSGFLQTPWGKRKKLKKNE
jgi:large subunit ribosomal protein L2